MTRDEVIHEMAELIAGLAVPYSISQGKLLGAAGEPWRKLYDGVHPGIGYATADEIEKALQEVLS